MQGIVDLLLTNDFEKAKQKAQEDYPFIPRQVEKRNYSKSIMLKVFMRDGFVDRYSGEKLYNPGLLRVLHILLPDEFPFHPHGKVNECHDIFWDLLPSVDHLQSLHRGGHDEMDNYVTTSMKRNLAKNNWSLEEIGWTLLPKGDLDEWDGLSREFLTLRDQFNNLLNTTYVHEWYNVTRKSIS